MPVQNPTSIKSGHSTQPSQRKASEPTATDFDALLAGSIEDAAETGKVIDSDKLASTDEADKGVQTDMTLPFASQLAAAQAEPAENNAASCKTAASLLELSETDQSKQPIPGTEIAALGADGPISQQMPSASVTLVTQSNPLSAETPLQYSKQTSFSSSAINRDTAANSGAALAYKIAAKDGGSGHRLTSFLAISGDLNTGDSKIAPEPGVVPLSGITLSGAPVDTVAGTGYLPTHIGLADPKTDFRNGESVGGKEIASVQTPIGSAQWQEEASQTIHLLLRQNHQQAEIKVNPAELGPIDIQIAMVQGEASISFVAEHGETRNALEMALPRLKELLADSGISLTGTFVGSERQPPQQSVPTPFKDLLSNSSGVVDSPILATTVLNINRFNQSGVDVYA